MENYNKGARLAVMRRKFNIPSPTKYVQILAQVCAHTLPFMCTYPEVAVWWASVLAAVPCVLDGLAVVGNGGA